MALPARSPLTQVHAFAQDIPNAAEVVVTVTEKPMLSLHTGTYVQARAVLQTLRSRQRRLAFAPPDARRRSRRVTRAAWR